MKLNDAQVRRLLVLLMEHEIDALRGGIGAGWADLHRGEQSGKADGFRAARRLITAIGGKRKP